MSSKNSVTDWLDNGLTPRSAASAESHLVRETQRADAKRAAKAGAPTQLTPLSRRATAVIQALPTGFRLHETRMLYPRVLEQLAAVWHDPRTFARTFTSLVIDERGGRQGFPLGVLSELTNLREYYFDEVHPEFKRPTD